MAAHKSRYIGIRSKLEGRPTQCDAAGHRLLLVPFIVGILRIAVREPSVEVFGVQRLRHARAVPERAAVVVDLLDGRRRSDLRAIDVCKEGQTRPNELMRD